MEALPFIVIHPVWGGLLLGVLFNMARLQVPRDQPSLVGCILSGQRPTMVQTLLVLALMPGVLLVVSTEDTLWWVFFSAFAADLATYLVWRAVLQSKLVRPD